MSKQRRRIVIIGGGIAGLCAAVYARKCGYDVVVLEQHSNSGGLATSWRRGGYTFETCLHWLLGSKPHGALHAQWQEVFDIGRLTFVDPDEYVRMVSDTGEQLPILTNLDRMETELLKHAPEDAAAIHAFARAVRRLAKLRVSDDFWPPTFGMILRNLPSLPLLRRLSQVTIAEYGERFRHPLLRSFFCAGETSALPALALMLSLAWMSERNAGHPIGGSQAVIRLIVENLIRRGGELRLGAKVKRILVENDAAVGAELIDGDTVRGDWVISAGDGHATIYELLGGRYVDETINQVYRTLRTFPSYLQVSFGIAQDLSREGRLVARVLDQPIQLDPGTELRQLSFRTFHYDRTFAPPGKTAVTCFLPTRNFGFWVDLKTHDSTRYEAEKRRVADAVADVLERSIPGLRETIEVTDVATPATVISITGNWQGSMEGWLMTPRTGLTRLPNTLPGLRKFLMVGQWVLPGGGLPSGLITARSAIRTVCKHDGMLFAPGAEPEEIPDSSLPLEHDAVL